MKTRINIMVISLILAVTPLWATGENRNPFQFEIAPAPPPVIENPASKKESTPKKPIEPTFVWKIQGIFQTKRGNTAILNHQFVSVGDVIRGWTVHDISPKAITLKNKTERVIVRF